jgi:hypothetical protein
MLKLEPPRRSISSISSSGRSPSHSWWWDSHNSPKHSKGLQSDLRGTSA